MNELIEKLKDKTYVRAFGLMSEEEQECYRKAEQKNCMTYSGHNWTINSRAANVFNNSFTYAIKPDYRPEPVFVNIEITGYEGMLGVFREHLRNEGFVIPPFIDHIFIHLHCLPSLPNFEGFYEEADDLQIGLRVELDFEGIARKHFEGKKVFAKLRRDT